MRNVKLSFLLVFFLLSCQGYADCPPFVESNTWWEAIAGGSWVKEIKVKAIKDQGVEGYFNPKIRVCAFDGKSYCYDLHSGTSCQKIYGTQKTGAGVSAAVFIDWEGDKTKAGGEFAKGLGWEWAEGVIESNMSKEEKEKLEERLAKLPKICACSQKGACMSGISSWGSRVFSGENIFRPGEMEKVCDTCYQTKVKCAPVPLAPGPPPFCEQLAMSPPQVRIVPIRNQDNDYFNPKVKIVIGDLKGKDGEPGEKLDYPEGKDKFKEHSIPDKDGIIHYLKTYREKDKLCAEYYGTEREESERKLQFPARCFPAPPAPKIEEVSIPKPNEGKGENTLKVKMKMSENVCTYDAHGTHENGVCTFDVNAGSTKYIGHLPLKVVKPAIVEKTTGNKDGVNNIIEGILKSDSQFKVLENYGYVPDIETECKEFKDNKCKLDDSGYPKIEVKYKENSKSKMLCLSGWQPEPEKFILEKGSGLVSLKSMRANYAKYKTVYSKESNQFGYFPCNETVDVLAKPQDELNEIIFNKKGYVSIPEENKNRDNCVANKDNEIDTKQNCNKCKIVYELTDGKHKEKCEQGDDDCLCFDGVCSRSTEYVDENDKLFYLRYKEVDCEDKNGKILKNEKGEVQKCAQLEDQPMKANRTEVFYANKLCRFDLEGLKKTLKEIIEKQLESKKKKLEEPYEFEGGYTDKSTDSLSGYDYVEIEAWGGGEAGHIKDKAQSTVSRPGVPGDYIKAQLKIDPSRPIMVVEVQKGGGNRELNASDKNGGSPTIKICNLQKQDCKELITVAGGGTTGTRVHKQDLKLEGEITRGRRFAEDNKIAYIEDGKIKYESVTCSKNYVNKTYGAGGCINESTKSYSKGSPGHVKIKPMFDEINKEKIDDAIEKMIQNPDDIAGIDDFLINKLDKKIIDTIKQEIRKELLGIQPKEK